MSQKHRTTSSQRKHAASTGIQSEACREYAHPHNMLLTVPMLLYCTPPLGRTAPTCRDMKPTVLLGVCIFKHLHFLLELSFSHTVSMLFCLNPQSGMCTRDAQNTPTSSAASHFPLETEPDRPPPRTRLPLSWMPTSTPPLFWQGVLHRSAPAPGRGQPGRNAPGTQRRRGGGHAGRRVGLHLPPGGLPGGLGSTGGQARGDEVGGRAWNGGLHVRSWRARGREAWGKRFFVFLFFCGLVCVCFFLLLLLLWSGLGACFIPCVAVEGAVSPAAAGESCRCARREGRDICSVM